MQKYFKRISLVIVLTMAMLGLCSATLLAATAITKGYSTEDKELKIGMAASFSDNSASSGSYVEKATYTNSGSFAGIVVKVDDSAVTVSNRTDTVYVADSGIVKAFVSDINGVPKKGDQLVVSPLKGILMRRTSETNKERVVAVANSDFGKSESTEQTIELDKGNKVTKVEQLEVSIRKDQTDDSSSDNSAIEELVFAITGRQVRLIRLVIAMTILFIILIIEGSIVYGAVSSSITAVGRNPLSKKSVYKQLVQTGALTLMILLFGIAGIYVVIYT